MNMFLNPHEYHYHYSNKKFPIRLAIFISTAINLSNKLSEIITLCWNYNYLEIIISLNVNSQNNQQQEKKSPWTILAVCATRNTSALLRVKPYNFVVKMVRSRWSAWGLNICKWSRMYGTSAQQVQHFNFCCCARLHLDERFHSKPTGRWKRKPLRCSQPWSQRKKSVVYAHKKRRQQQQEEKYINYSKFLKHVQSTLAGTRQFPRIAWNIIIIIVVTLAHRPMQRVWLAIWIMDAQGFIMMKVHHIQESGK